VDLEVGVREAEEELGEGGLGEEVGDALHRVRPYHPDVVVPDITSER